MTLLQAPHGFAPNQLTSASASPSGAGSGSSSVSALGIGPGRALSAASASPSVSKRTRDRVLALVRERAWTSTELGEALGVDRKTADYHLHALRREGLVAERVVHGERRFAHAAGAPRAFATAAPGRTRFRIARVVETRGLVTLDDLARATGVSHGLAAYHVRKLAQEDIVRVRRMGSRVLVQAKGLAAQAEVTVAA